MADKVEAVEAIQGLRARAVELRNLAEEAITARLEAESHVREEARQRGAEKHATDLASRMAELEAELRRVRG